MLVKVVFFADNLAQIGIYLKDFQENPHLAGGVGMEIYVLCVWLVNVMLVNFYLLVAYLWYMLPDSGRSSYANLADSPPRAGSLSC